MYQKRYYLSDMENKIIGMKRGFQGRRAFALLFTIFLAIFISIVSYKIVENNIFFSNLNKQKYLHLQATIFMDKAINFIQHNASAQILSYTLNDPRFQLEIVQKEQSGSEVYYVMIETVDETPIRLSEKIIK